MYLKCFHFISSVLEVLNSLSSVCIQQTLQDTRKVVLQHHGMVIVSIMSCTLFPVVTQNF